MTDHIDPLGETHYPNWITGQSSGPVSDDGWTPDARTVQWWVGRANEDRIVDTLREEVMDRGAHLEPLSAEFWRLVASVAVEHLTFDMVDQAKAAGTTYPRD